MTQIQLRPAIRISFPGVLTVLAALAAGPAEAQAPPFAVGAVAQARTVDMRTLDPHSFKAMAVRLPPGSAPRIDGRLDDEVWALATAFGDFIQREPNVGALSTERTEFKVLFDDAKMYVAIWAYEPHNGGIVASEMLRTHNPRNRS